MLFKSESDQAIRKLNLDKAIEGDKLRKKRMADRWSILSGDYEHLVRAEIARTFGNKQILTVPDVTLNTFKVICEEIFRHPGAHRAFLVGDDAEDPTYAALLERMSVQRVMARATVIAGATNDCLIRTLPGAAPGAPPSLRIFAPHEVTVIADRDDPGSPAVVTYEVEDPLDGIWQVVWTPTEHYRVSEKGKILPVPGATDTRNPLGFVPRGDRRREAAARRPGQPVRRPRRS